MSAPAATIRTASISADVRTEFAQELQKEDDLVLYPLLDRIAELSDRLSEGVRVDADYLLEAVQLWGRYVNEMHERRVNRLVHLVPEALPHLGQPGSRGRRFRRHREPIPTSTSGPDSPDVQYGEIRQDQERMAQRIRVLESLVSDYRKSQFLARELLASLLRSGAFSDRAWAKYEESFALRCLEQAADPNISAALERDAAGSSVLRDQVVEEVRRFLRRPIAVGAVAAGVGRP